MVSVGYTREFAAGVICNAGTLGILIPPSIVMVVYAAATDVSVGRMFLAGVFPGLLAGLMLMVAIYIVARIKRSACPAVGRLGRGLRRRPRCVVGADADRDHPGRHLWRHLHADRGRRGRCGLCIPDRQFRLPGHGAVQRKEAGSMAMVPLRAVSIFWHPDTKHALFEAGKLTIMLLFIIANALILKHVLTEERLPQMITEAMLSAGLGSDRVPDRGQRAAADRRPVHGAVRSADHRCAAGVPDRHDAGYRPDPPRHHHGGEHGDRDDHAAGGSEPVRDRGCGSDVGDRT